MRFPDRTEQLYDVLILMQDTRRVLHQARQGMPTLNHVSQHVVLQLRSREPEVIAGRKWSEPVPLE